MWRNKEIKDMNDDEFASFLNELCDCNIFDYDENEHEKKGENEHEN